MADDQPVNLTKETADRMAEATRWYEHNTISSRRENRRHRIRGPKAAPSIIKIAASDSSSGDKDAADKVCDGTDDQKEISSAISQMGTTGFVLLYAGTYYFSEPVEISKSNNPILSDLRIQGETTSVNILPVGSPEYAIKYRQDTTGKPKLNLTLENFTINENSGNKFQSAGLGIEDLNSLTIHDVDVKNTDNRGVQISGAYSGVSMINCNIENNASDGIDAFTVHGSFYGHDLLAKNNGNDGFYIQQGRMYNCTADNNGWVGFDGEMICRNCVATDNVDSGFRDCIYTGGDDSESNGNGNYGVEGRTLSDLYITGNNSNGDFDDFVIQFGKGATDTVEDDNGDTIFKVNNGIVTRFVSGYSGSFTNGSGDTVTVHNGLITDIS